MTAAEAREGFELHSPDLGAVLSFCTPVSVRRLLANSLSGWHLSSLGGEAAAVRVSFTERYVLESEYYTPARSYSDPVSLLNETLIAIAYGVKRQRPDLLLLHGAAYEDKAGCAVVFGARKSGKSVLTAERAAAGALIYADDLLLWSPKDLKFTGLGFSPRLRRPVPSGVVESLGTGSFIAGRHACYLAADAIRLAPAGRSFSPDRVVTLEEGRQSRPVRFYNVRRQIERHRIC